MSIPLIQKYLQEEGLDGWLLYDFHGINPIFHKILALPQNRHITRKVYYWIPQKGECLKIVHKIELHVLDGVDGELKTYAKREELEYLLLQIRGRVAMEYAKDIPYISFVDGGTVDYLRSLDRMEIVSSGTILQKLLSSLSKEGIKSHLEASQIVDKIVDEAFSFVQKTHPFEKDVSNFILRRFEEEGCMTEHAPIVAKGANSANPHYEIKGKGDKINKGDFVLIDLWCKKKGSDSVYADITRVGVLGEPSKKMNEAFNAVREAQKVALELVKVGRRGADIDKAARAYLEEKGYAPFILHRLGHSIDTNLHGRGANLDSFESFDTRVLIPNSCYSIEPALYFPGEFGLRLEHDVLLTDNGVQVTGGVQEEIKRL